MKEEKEYNTFITGLLNTTTPRKKPQISNNTLTRIKICPLCEIEFSIEELRNNIQIQLISKAYEHLRKRGIIIFEQFNFEVFAGNPESSVNICAICHTLIMEEQELINTEELFVEYQNLNIKDEILEDKPNIKNATKTLYQWRIILHIRLIENLPMEAFDWEKSYYNIQYKLVNDYTKINMNFCDLIESGQRPPKKEILTSPLVRFILNRLYKRTNRLPINVFKMHYIFTEENADPNVFLDRLRMEFRITEIGNWKLDILKDTSYIFRPIINRNPINYYIENPVTFQQSINLYSPTNKAAKLHMDIGLIRDNIEQQIPVKYLYWKDIFYFTEPRYHTYHPLPPAFLDLLQLNKNIDLYNNLETENSIENLQNTLLFETQSSESSSSSRSSETQNGGKSSDSIIKNLIVEPELKGNGQYNDNNATFNDEDKKSISSVKSRKNGEKEGIAKKRFSIENRRIKGKSKISKSEIRKAGSSRASENDVIGIRSYSAYKTLRPQIKLWRNKIKYS